MKVMLPLILLALAAPQDLPDPKDPPKITYEDSGDFRLMVKDLEHKFPGRIRFRGRIPSKDVSVSIRDAGFYEALDALCRAHKEATYFLEEELHHESNELTVVPGPWIEYPSTYHGHFKTALVGLLKTRRSTPEGDEARVEAEVVLHGPPWISLTWESGAAATWEISEARDADGRDVLASDGLRSGDERIRIGLDMNRTGNLTTHSVALRDFELDRGLKIFAGKATLKTHDNKAVRLEVEAGAAAVIPQGTLTIDSIKELERSERESGWMISMVFKPNAASKELKLDRIIGGRARHEGDRGQWGRVELPWEGRTFEVETLSMKRAPKWIELNVRTRERTFEIPFRFTDVAFRGK